MSHDRYKYNYIDGYGRKKVWPGRTEGIDWWPEEVPSQDDFDNACRNLDRVGWKVDHVITHTCPESQRSWFISGNRPPDPTEEMLERIYRRRRRNSRKRQLEFKSWHFGHFHCEKQVGKFFCHFGQVREIKSIGQHGGCTVDQQPVYSNVTGNYRQENHHERTGIAEIKKG